TPLRAILSVIIVFSIRKNEIKYDVVQVASKGNNALDCPVVSRAKAIDVRNALEAPANNADIPTSTANGIFIPTSGNQYIPTLPSNAPAAPPMVIKGASVPPEVPLLNDIDHDIYFSTHNETTTFIASVPENKSVILKYPTPSVRGEKYPTTPTAIPPIAGHHAQ